MVILAFHHLRQGLGGCLKRAHLLLRRRWLADFGGGQGEFNTMVDLSGAQGNFNEAGLEVFGLPLPCHEGICVCAEIVAPVIQRERCAEILQ